jgi:glycylpeptide N-tetradecanoyltransferase
MSTTVPAKKTKKEESENAVDENKNTNNATDEQQAAETDKLSKTMQDVLALSRVEKFKKKVDDADPEKKHVFWDTQPVPKLRDEIKEEECGAIDVPKTVADVRQDPLPLPAGFEWCETNVDDEKTLTEVYTLLSENYVEDDDNMFRFDYSVNFLHWALKPPGFLPFWHIGVRVTTNKKLVGFITAIPADMKVYHQDVKMVEINFLCVHKRLREKRLAPVLIKEITRRVNLQNIWQAVYTAGRVLPKPIASCRYYHRSLNPKKLIDVGFSHLGHRMTIARTIKLYKLPDAPQSPGIRALAAGDVPSATRLLNTYLASFSIKQHFTEAEFAHWFLPRPDVMNAYVVENPKTHEITDLVSFYTLPSSIIGNPNYKTLKAAYSYYNVATSVPLVQLMRDALVFAKKCDFDVFNCLDIMDNESFLNDLKFGKGDGNLQYYLYNWRCPAMEQPKVGLVLL